jgi:hypothetical protein
MTVQSASLSFGESGARGPEPFHCCKNWTAAETRDRQNFERGDEANRRFTSKSLPRIMRIIVQITSLCIAPISREAISRSAAIQRGRRGNGSICWQCRTISRLFLVRDVGTQCNLFARSRVSMSFPSCVFSYVRPAAMSRPKRSLRRNELTNLFENPAAGALGAKPRGCCRACTLSTRGQFCYPCCKVQCR